MQVNLYQMYHRPVSARTYVKKGEAKKWGKTVAKTYFIKEGILYVLAPDMKAARDEAIRHLRDVANNKQAKVMIFNAIKVIEGASGRLLAAPFEVVNE